LEEYSDERNKKIGWLSRKKKTDLICYAKVNSKQLYLFSFPILQSAWHRNYRQWKEEFGVIPVDNYGKNGKKLYTTTNIPVPLTVLEHAMATICGYRQ